MAVLEVFLVRRTERGLVDCCVFLGPVFSSLHEGTGLMFLVVLYRDEGGRFRSLGEIVLLEGRRGT